METREDDYHSIETLIGSVHTVRRGVVTPYMAIQEVNGKPLNMKGHRGGDDPDLSGHMEEYVSSFALNHTKWGESYTG